MARRHLRELASGTWGICFHSHGGGGRGQAGRGLSPPLLGAPERHKALGGGATSAVVPPPAGQAARAQKASRGRAGSPLPVPLAGRCEGDSFSSSLKVTGPFPRERCFTPSFTKKFKGGLVVVIHVNTEHVLITAPAPSDNCRCDSIPVHGDTALPETLLLFQCFRLGPDGPQGTGHLLSYH